MEKRLKRSNNSDFWIKKISGNIEHDKQIDESLALLGWTVLRFWGEDIKKHTAECVKAIDEAVLQTTMEQHER